MMIPPFLAFCGTVQPDALLLRSHAIRIRQALVKAEIDMKQACAVMSIDQGQLCRQLSGDGHISLTRLMLLPDAFWQYYGLLLAEDYGLPPMVVRAGRVWLALRARKQLRMTAEPQIEERRKLA